jgi:CheY-like chemotaxis protein
VTADIVPGLRVLVLEDDALIAMYLQELLEDSGCNVIGPAPRVGKALELLQQHEPDVAILDLNLAGVYPTAVAEVLRSRRVPFLVLSGYNESELDDALLRGVPRLTKPVRIQELLEHIAALVTDARIAS